MKEERPHYHGHKKRLREKFLKSGLDTLADYEAVELLLSMAIVRQDVKPLAKKLLESLFILEILIREGDEINFIRFYVRSF